MCEISYIMAKVESVKVENLQKLRAVTINSGKVRIIGKPINDRKEIKCTSHKAPLDKLKDAFKQMCQWTKSRKEQKSHHSFQRLSSKGSQR